MSLQNPFICYGSDGLSTICGRPAETAGLLSLAAQNENVVVRSPRRIGKTVFFRQAAEEFRKKGELCIIADIFPARSISDFATILANAFLEGTERKGGDCKDGFVKFISYFFETAAPDMAEGLTRERLRLRAGILAEEAVYGLLRFLEKFPGAPVLFIDDFQQTLHFDASDFLNDMMRRMCYSGERYIKVLGTYGGTTEALLLGNGIPYAMTEFGPLPREIYFDYARQLLIDDGRTLPEDVFTELYGMMSGVTSFIQRILAVMYDITRPGQTCSRQTVWRAIDRVLDENAYIYEDFIRELPVRQKELLVIIARRHHVTGMASAEFCFANGITASSMQSARRALLEKQLISEDGKVTSVKDEFFRLWINRTF